MPAVCGARLCPRVTACRSGALPHATAREPAWQRGPRLIWLVDKDSWGGFSGQECIRFHRTTCWPLSRDAHRCHGTPPPPIQHHNITAFVSKCCKILFLLTCLLWYSFPLSHSFILRIRTTDFASSVFRSAFLYCSSLRSDLGTWVNVCVDLWNGWPHTHSKFERVFFYT